MCVTNNACEMQEKALCCLSYCSSLMEIRHNNHAWLLSYFNTRLIFLLQLQCCLESSIVMFNLIKTTALKLDFSVAFLLG